MFISSILALYNGLLSTRVHLFDVVEIPHLVDSFEDNDINISKDFDYLEKSLKYMKRNSYPHVFLHISAEVKELMTNLKTILRAIGNYKKSLSLLDFDKDHEIC